MKVHKSQPGIQFLFNFQLEWRFGTRKDVGIIFRNKKWQSSLQIFCKSSVTVHIKKKSDYVKNIFLIFIEMNSYKRVNSILISVDTLASPGVNKHKICIPECRCSPMSLCVSRENWLNVGLCNVITQYCYTSHARITKTFKNESVPTPCPQQTLRSRTPQSTRIARSQTSFWARCRKVVIFQGLKP